MSLLAMSGPGLASNKHSAARLIVIMGAMIFCVEGLVMLALSHFTFTAEAVFEALTDAAVLTITVAPMTYFFLLRPFEHKLFAVNQALNATLSESRESEAALADSLATLNVQKTILDRHCLVSQTDVRGRITYVNDEFCRVSGHSRDELIGSNHRIVKSGHHPIEFWHGMYAAIARDGIWQGQVCNRAKDGTVYWVQATNIAERDGSGRIVGYISVRSNITETKKREQELGNAHTELKEAIKRAEAASRAKSGFLSTMSHEMRTPLNGIIGAMELLRLESLSERQKGLVDLATQSSEALLVHINDVLDFSKMEAGKIELVPRPFNLQKLVGSVVDIVMPQVRNGHNEIRTEIAPEMPASLVGDQVRLRQILLNFVSNAAKFTRKGAITITVAPIKTYTSKSVLEFAVTDTGLGIPIDRLGELFKEFTMLDSSYTRRTGGTGLGLAISKSLVEMMGGRIGVESKEGHGSRFWFTAELPHAAETAPETAEGSDQIMPAQRLNVLLVDDNSTNRLVGNQLLTAAGHDVTVASSGRGAVEAAAERPFDVILMDISMPEMDGLEATRLIRAESRHNRETPIVALTAHAVVGDRERFLAAGMNDYLSKPIRLANLKAGLDKFGKRSHQPDDVAAAPASAPTPATAPTAAGAAAEAIDPAVLDPSELATLAEQTSREVIPVVVEEFLKELQTRSAELTAAAAERSTSGVQAVAHAISGSASSVGARRLAALAKSIELDCAAGRLDEALTRTLKLPGVVEATQAACRAATGRDAADAA